MRKHEPADIGAAVARLAGQVDRIEHDLSGLARLQGDVQAHSRTLGDLADLIRRLRTTSASIGPAAPAPLDAGADDEAEPIPEWLTVTDPQTAVVWLSDLDQWTRDVWIRYQPLPICWFWHPAVVAELLCCRHLWAAALTPGLGCDALAAWHDRWRPGVAHRIGRGLAACDRAFGAHVDGSGGRWIPDPAALDDIAVWWASTHASTPPPGLTREDRP